MKDLDGRDITLMPQDRFLLGGPLILRGFAHKSVFYSQESRQGSTSQNSERLTNAGLDCYLGGKAFWRTCAQFYFPMPYLRRKNNWIADNVKGKFLFFLIYSEFHMESIFLFRNLYTLYFMPHWFICILKVSLQPWKKCNGQ